MEVANLAAQVEVGFSRRRPENVAAAQVEGTDEREGVAVDATTEPRLRHVAPAPRMNH